LVLYIYAVTLFVSAFILFLVQPLIGKMILPKLGGTPQVWNTCMVFFQMVLLLGYAYTHTISTSLKLRQQLLLHMVLLILPLGVLFLLPINFFNLYVAADQGGWNPGNFGGNPIMVTLLILLIVIGLPFLVVSTTAPLLQRWFAYTGHPSARDPYFLYGASNLGSLLALIAYPVLIEPTTNLDTQTYIWLGGYFALIATVLTCVGLVWATSAKADEVGHGHADTAPPPSPENPPATAVQASTAVAAGTPHASKPTGIKPLGKKGLRGAAAAAMPEAVVTHRTTEEITVGRRLKWICLAAVPSSLMLGITTHITTDLSPIPLFWVIPLALYLLTFVLVFARWPVVWTEKAHPFVIYLQPIFICALLFLDMIPTSTAGITATIVFNMLGFFATTLLCHGELAKDRPSTRHLTEFYLWMSVGGMLGGMFNALVAPMVFTGLAELSIAIFAAGFLRPRMKDSGWTDDLVAGLLEPAPEAPVHSARGGKQARPHPVIAKPGATPQMAMTLDFVLPACIFLLTLALAFVVTGPVASLAAMFQPRGGEGTVMIMFLTFGVPLAIACFYYARPVRFGLAVGAVILAHYLFDTARERSEYNDRSYFGIISVKMSVQNVNNIPMPYRTLMHGSTNHGMNFLAPEKDDDIGDPSKDFTRLATTYYHRLGPAGRVMELFNWFPNSGDNVYWADARMPAAIVGQAMADIGTSTLPFGNLVNLWSEPPYCTIGLGTGTMASYGRPYQHVHYYEIDNHIRRLSLPGKAYYTYAEADDIRGKKYFTYLDGAIRRGSEVQVLMGDARLRMALPYKNFHTSARDEVPGGGPERFYHMMVVDAFSSDAIPAHLITKEAIRMYFRHLSEEGILCVHTSNRYVALPKVVAAVADALNSELTSEEQKAGYSYSCIRGSDQAPFEKVGHFTSEWVMVARKPDYLQRVKAMEPEGYDAALRRMASRKGARIDAYWRLLTPQRRFVWTDNYYTLWPVLRIWGERDD
jgi:hypothetical protein